MENYYFGAVGVAATLFSVLVIGLAGATVWLALRAKKVLDKFDRVAANGAAISAEIRELVHGTADRIVSLEKLLLTVNGLKAAARFVAGALHRRQAAR